METQEQKKHKKHPGKEVEVQKKGFGVWQIVSALLSILLIASIFTSGFGGSGGRSMSASKTATKVLSYLNANVLQGQPATLGNVEDAGSVYAIDLTVGGRTLTTYASKDGRYFFPNGLDLDSPPPQLPDQGEGSTPPAAQPSVDMAKLVDDDPMKGQKSAPVTIVEFSDFQCPFCARFYTDTLTQIQKDYIDTGKVKIVYRDFPLSFHTNAQPAAEAAECADDQGKFWQFHDKLFENQQALSGDNYKLWAKELGLDTKKFNDCVDSNKYASEVQKDMTDGQAAGVSGTPAFFVNGQFLSGAQPYAAFKSAIDAALAE